MKKTLKRTAGFLSTAISAWAAGFFYELGRKHGKTNESASPKEFLSGLGGSVGGTFATSPVARMIAERAMRKAAERVMKEKPRSPDSQPYA